MKAIRFLIEAKNKGTYLFVFLAAGATLMMLARLLTPDREPVEDAGPTPAYSQPPLLAPQDISGVRAIEERLEAFFSLIEGAGRVRVMVGFSADRETVYAVDEVTSDAFTREEDALGGSRETRQTAGTTHTVLIPDRNGASRPLVLRESEPNVLGIVIIAEGGDSPFVRAELTRAARAVLGLEAHKIEVLTMRNG